jgi:hypothetical protein
MNNSELQMSKKLSKLRTIIQKSLRVQRGSAEQVAYIDTGNVLADACARQNHVIFARRGCGKTLLLHSERRLGKGIHSVYLNCEEFKRHSFPNVLIEILDALFEELEKHLSAWFGRKARSKELIRKIRSDLTELKTKADETEASVKATSSAELSGNAGAELGSGNGLTRLIHRNSDFGWQA